MAVFFFIIHGLSEMDEGHLLTSLRFPTMNPKMTSHNPTNKHQINDRHKNNKVILPSLSKNLPTRIHRKSTRFQLERRTIPLDQQLLLHIDENRNYANNNESKTNDTKKVLLKTVTHIEKFSRQKHPSFYTTTATTKPTFGDTERTFIRSANDCYSFLQHRSPTSLDQQLTRLESKQMTSTEKVKKWLKNHYVDGLKVIEDSTSNKNEVNDT